MEKTAVIRPFLQGFLSDFVFAPTTLPFSDTEISDLDRELVLYEQTLLNPDIEKSLISKNELLASFAISKAENSNLTLEEAETVYNLLLTDPEYDFIAGKLKTKKKLTSRDYDRLEFFNIAKVFQNVNKKIFSFEELTPFFIRSLHAELTRGLDIFQKYLPQFTLYHSGSWRDNDAILVGDYIPASFLEIPQGVEELLSWMKKHQTVSGISIFHTALYALHPFNNGNKRVCRILEHILLRTIGMNAKNLYSTSYYYHQHKARYYKYLLYSLERKNLNHFPAFMLEAVFFSIFDVIATSLEVKRSEFIQQQNAEGSTKLVLRQFVKRNEIQFKTLARITKTKMARQTLATALQNAVAKGILSKRDAGRTTYYRLALEAPETLTLHRWLEFAKKRLAFIPDDYKSAALNYAVQ